MKFPSYLVRIIDSFIRGRNFAVHVNSYASHTITPSAGLPQGTCIWPILYALFTADLPQIENTEIALYADDTSIYTTAKQSNTIIKRLNRALITLHLYFKKWRIKMNDSKTQAIIFPFNRKHRRIPTIPLHNNQHIIELATSVTYLGITFDKMMTFQIHTQNAINKTNKCFRALYSLLAHKSHLSIENGKLIFTSVLRPILSYGSPVWSTAADTMKTIFVLPPRTPTISLESMTVFKMYKDFLLEFDDKFLQNCSISNFHLIREIEITISWYVL